MIICYDAKIAKICNLWAFWTVIQLINHVNQIFAIYASWLSGILKSETVFLKDGEIQTPSSLLKIRLSPKLKYLFSIGFADVFKNVSKKISFWDISFLDRTKMVRCITKFHHCFWVGSQKQRYQLWGGGYHKIII